MKSRQTRIPLVWALRFWNRRALGWGANVVTEPLSMGPAVEMRHRASRDLHPQLGLQKNPASLGTGVKVASLLTLNLSIRGERLAHAQRESAADLAWMAPHPLPGPPGKYRPLVITL